MEWLEAPDIEKEIRHLVRSLKFDHIDSNSIHCVRSYGSTSRAIARIWSLPRIWRQVLNINPQYVLEVVSQYYDKQSDTDKRKTLIHELMHIPKNFSGALVPHRGIHKRIDHKNVESFFKMYKMSE